MMMVHAQQPQDTAAEALIAYQNFDQAKMIAAEAPTVLFFHASWCPTCRSAREEFNKRQSEFKNINLILVDYDNSNDLKKMYGVTYQHTFVQKALNDRDSNNGETDGFDWSIAPEATEISNYGDAPELIAKGPWLNTDQPFSMENLEGKVVLVDFWTYSCINCVRTIPHLIELYEKYEKDGLQIIAVHSPEFPFE